MAALVAFVAVPERAHAAVFMPVFTALASSAAANNSATITFTLSVTKYECSKQYTHSGGSYTVWPADPATCANYTNTVYSPTPQDLSPTLTVPVEGYVRDISTTGSGNTLSAASITTDAAGKASFTLKSSVAEAKTVKLLSGAKGGTEPTQTVTFTAVAASPAPKKITPPPAPAPAPVPPPAPETPKPATITIDDEAVDATKPIEVEEDKPLVLSGKTVANGVVKLYIFSEPKTASVTADKDGNWTYGVTDLPSGEHHIESEVTDPATGLTSARSSVLAFTVKAAAATDTPDLPINTKPERGGLSIIAIATIVAVVAALAGGAFWWWKKKRSPSSPKHPAESAPTPAGTAHDDQEASSSSDDTDPTKD